jgi:hypothetical protein
MGEIISWDRAIGKKVRSADDRDLGNVQNMTRDYIKTSEGKLSKNYYFIPKFYLSGYDGDRLWVSLAKNEVKSRFERETAPDPSELGTTEDAKRRAVLTDQFPELATSIPPGMLQMPWDKIIGKKVKSSDKKVLGDVESVSTDYIEVKEGMVSKKHYYVPKHCIKGFDGDNLYASLTKGEIEDRFERNSPPLRSELPIAEREEKDLAETGRAKTSEGA